MGGFTYGFEFDEIFEDVAIRGSGTPLDGPY
jgi:hypothetical protein